jgi:prepilin-type N-terminal cleavage/methylation domain-containing protein
MRKFLRRLTKGEQGYSLIELLVTMVIMVIVLSSLTTVFVSGSSAESDLNRRFQAQQNARLALDSIRADIHCASAAQPQTINTFPGLKLAEASCYALTPTISWCAVQVTATRFQLYRSTTTGATTCTSGDAARKLIADYLTTSAAFPATPIRQYTLQRVGVDFKVSVNVRTPTADVYELTDSIATRNATRCLIADPCTTPVVP